MRYSDYKVNMGTILSQIRSKLGPKVENSMVSYWCPKMECYVYIGQMVPLNEDKQLPNATAAKGEQMQMD